jgi:hypothetical protein
MRLRACGLPHAAVLLLLGALSPMTPSSGFVNIGNGTFQTPASLLDDDGFETLGGFGKRSPLGAPACYVTPCKPRARFVAP